ncbi:MAG: acyl-ACP--UDP-N-acetylglucosamine O-acyltransferase [Cyclobacteriaceae bacterium]
MSQQLANIHPDAQIAKSAVIEPFATVEKNTVIGEGTWVGSGAVIMDGARIGKNCRIHNSAVVSCMPQDLKYEGEETLTEIADSVVIREFATISKGTADRNKTVIGEGSLVMAYGHVGHDCLVGKHCIIGNVTQLGGHCIIDDYAIISAMSAVHQFSNIGCHVMVAGGSIVVKDVPPYAMAARNPISYHGVNSVGLKRRGFEKERIHNIQNIYRQIYFGGLNYSEAIKKIEEETEFSEEREAIASFIRKSERGIIKASV